MMKMSRHERNIFNQGKKSGFAAGYAEGYSKGIYDGNPFNKLADAIVNMSKEFAAMAINSDAMKAIEEYNQSMAEGEQDDSVSGDDSLESEDEEE